MTSDALSSLQPGSPFLSSFTEYSLLGTMRLVCDHYAEASSSDVSR